MKRWLLWFVLGCVAFTSAPALATQGKFSVPLVRSASVTAIDARTALESGDLVQAAAALSELLDSEPGTLIDLNPAQSGASLSAPDAWVGATRWARGQASSGPPKLRQLLSQERATASQIALQKALAARRGSTTAVRRLALERVSQIFPGTQAGQQASLLLGDLEFEAGHGARALAAWRNALGNASPEMRTAIELRLAQVKTKPNGTGAASTSNVPPLIEGSWLFELPETPWASEYTTDWALHPVASNGLVWINTSLSVLAIDVSTGTLVWDSGEPAGWAELTKWKRRELSRGVGSVDLISRVATDGRVVIAAQQLAFTENENEQVDGHTITVALPERRLFAFDAQTGAALWNHAPDSIERLSGVSLKLAEQARVSAPPLIVGDLVFVPSYELAGRINLHVSAFDLFTGEPVWDRLIVSGQTRVNLFGEHEVEFNSAPLALAGENLIVATGLGVIASLDLSSGEPHWSQDYTRFDLPKTNGYYTPSASRRWNNSRPIVTTKSVYVTPADSPDLIVLNRDTGQIELEISGLELEKIASQGLPEGASLAHLVDADEIGPWLGGEQLASFKFDQDGRLVQRFASIETPTGSSSYSAPVPRPQELLVPRGGPILVATDAGVLAVNRSTGQVQDLGPIDLEDWVPGNLALENNRLLVLESNRLTGWVNWDTIIDAGLLALEALPQNHQSEVVRLEVASALVARAAAYTTRERDLDLARDMLFEHNFTTLNPTDLRLPRLRFELLRSEGELLAESDQQGAFKSFRAALDLGDQISSDLTRQLGVLFDALKLLGAPSATTLEAGWRRTARDGLLKDLSEKFAREVLPDELAARLRDELPAVLGQLDPSLAELAHDLGPKALSRTPLGFFAELARAAIKQRTNDASGALQVLHAALWEYGDLVIAGKTSLGLLSGPIEARIETLLNTPGGLAAYAAFEQAAERQLVHAIAAPKEQRAGLYTRILHKWPQSQAAGRAQISLLDAQLALIDLDLGDLSDLAAVARPLTKLPNQTRVRAFLALARGAVISGNLELAELFAKRLIELAPDDPGARALGFTRDRTRPSNPGERRRFQGPLGLANGLASVRLGSFIPLFPIALQAINAGEDDSGPDQLLLVAGTDGALLAFEADKGGEIRWSFPGGGYSSAPWLNRVVALPHGAARIVATITTGGIAGIEPRTGYLAWSRSPPHLRPISLVGGGGLVCVQWVDATGRRTIEGLDAFGGALLWRFELPQNPKRVPESLRLLLSGTRLALIGQNQTSNALILDATTGFTLGELAFAKDTGAGDREAAFFQGMNLCLPRILAGTGGRSNVLDIFDLNSVRKDVPMPPSFSLPLGEQRELAGIVHAPSGDFLWMIGVGRERNGTPGDALLEVDAGLGALRHIASLLSGEKPIGLKLGETLDLDADFIIVAGPPGKPGRQSGLNLRCIALPLGPLWSISIAAPIDPRWIISDTSIPSAVFSQESVAFVYAQSGTRKSMGQELHLFVVDRQNGSVQSNRVLVSQLGSLAGIALDGVGGELFVFGRGSSAGRGRLEVLEGKDQ